MTPSETYLHPNDAGVAKHIVSNAVAHSNPEKARAAIRRRYSKAYEFEKGQTDSVGHAVFGAGSAISLSKIARPKPSGHTSSLELLTAFG